MKSIENLEKIIKGLESKMVANTISEEVKADVEQRIAELQAVIDELNTMKAAAETATEDKSEELKTQVAELTARVKNVENKFNGSMEIKNDVQKIVKNKKFAQEFFEVVKNSSNKAEFRNNWNEVAKRYISNGINENNANDFLPAFVVNEINDQFIGKRHRLLELVDWTGLPCFKALWETGNEGANVHVPGTQKTEQNLTFEPIEIRPDYVYKYITIDKKMERESQDSGDVLIRYITKELVDRLLSTIENFILLGTAPFAKPTEVSISGGIVDALAYMEDTDGAVAIMSPAKYLEIKNTVTGVNSRLATHDDVLAYLGVEEIIFNKTTYVPESGTWAGLWYMRPEDYKLVGDRRPDEYVDFNLAYNKKEYLTEIYIGGGCVVPNNFIALMNA